MAYKRISPTPVVEGGTGAQTLTGVLIGNGASPVTGNTVTQYDVLVGGASNAITSVSPSTAGYVLTSTGVGSDPSFQLPSQLGSLLFYLTNTASSVATYLQLTASTFTPKTTQTFTTIGSGSTLLKNYITNAGVPNLTTIPAGIYLFHVHADQTAGTRNVQLYAEFWESSSVGADIAKIGTTGLTPVLTGVENEFIVDFSLSSPYILGSTASRITCRVFAQGAALGSNATVNIFVGDEADSHIQLPASAANVTNFVPYTGAISDVNLGTHSITANSATLTTALTVPNGGTGAATLTGILTGNGASAITANAVTQYGTVIAGASNAVSSVAPSATSGVPYISQGAAANPTFGTAVVAGGGTGVTSNTAYAVLCGGTTSTNPVQSIAGVGSAGQVLTSNGAGALPTFQAAGGTSVVVQQIRAKTSSLVACATVLPLDDTIPQKTEGNEVLTVTITPTNSSSILVIDFFGCGAMQGGNGIIGAALFQDTTANALAACSQTTSGLTSTNISFNLLLRHYMTAGTTSATTFKIRVGPKDVSLTFNVNGDTVGNRIYGGVAATTLTVTEYTA